MLSPGAGLPAFRPTVLMVVQQQFLLLYADSALTAGATDPQASFGPASWGTCTRTAAAAQSSTLTNLSWFAADEKHDLSIGKHRNDLPVQNKQM